MTAAPCRLCNGRGVLSIPYWAMGRGFFCETEVCWKCRPDEAAKQQTSTERRRAGADEEVR